MSTTHPGWLLRTVPPCWLHHSLCKDRQGTLNDLYTILWVRRCGFRPKLCIWSSGRSWESHFTSMSSLLKSRTLGPHASCYLIQWWNSCKTLSKTLMLLTLCGFIAILPDFLASDAIHSLTAFSLGFWHLCVSRIKCENSWRKEQLCMLQPMPSRVWGPGTPTSALPQYREERWGGRPQTSLLHSQVWLNHNNHLLLCSNLHLTKCFHEIVLVELEPQKNSIH